jgi:hypothetical protein
MTPGRSGVNLPLADSEPRTRGPGPRMQPGARATRRDALRHERVRVDRLRDRARGARRRDARALAGPRLGRHRDHGAWPRGRRSRAAPRARRSRRDPASGTGASLRRPWSASPLPMPRGERGLEGTSRSARRPQRGQGTGGPNARPTAGNVQLQGSTSARASYSYAGAALRAVPPRSAQPHCDREPPSNAHALRRAPPTSLRRLSGRNMNSLRSSRTIRRCSCRSDSSARSVHRAGCGDRATLGLGLAVEQDARPPVGRARADCAELQCAAKRAFPALDSPT